MDLGIFVVGSFEFGEVTAFKFLSHMGNRTCSKTCCQSCLGFENMGPLAADTDSFEEVAFPCSIRRHLREEESQAEMATLS